MGNPGNMTSSFPSTWAEPVDPYMAGAHGDHLVRGVNVGPGYAGTAAANGDIHAPTGSLPAGERLCLVTLSACDMMCISETICARLHTVTLMYRASLAADRVGLKARWNQRGLTGF